MALLLVAGAVVGYLVISDDDDDGQIDVPTVQVDTAVPDIDVDVDTQAPDVSVDGEPGPEGG